MKLISSILTLITGLVFTATLLPAQTSDFSNVQLNLGAATDTQTLLAQLATVEPVAFASLPKDRLNRVAAAGFWSFQMHNWPPLPGNVLGLDVWPLGSGVFVLDDRNVDYAALQAAAELAAQLDEAATLKSSPTAMRMMSSSLTSYGHPVYLTNLVVTTSPMSASFDVAGGTNFVPYDLVMTTNLAAADWNWLGIGYTSNRYSFTSQPSDMAFYRLAKPSRTMTVVWGDNAYGQTDIPDQLTNAVAVSAGYEFSLALLTNGTVVGWGYNGASSAALVPTNLVGVTMLASGWSHNVALLTNRTVRVWGDNFWGQLNVPSGLTNVCVVSAQALHSLALLTNGTVLAWGYNTGLGEATVPAALTNVTAIAAGAWHNLAVSNGYVVAWGDNSYGQSTMPTNLNQVMDVAASFTHSVALKKDGTVVCWGGNANGECCVPAGLTNVVAIAAGGYLSPATGFTLAVTKDGSLVVWGSKKIAAALQGVDHVIGLGAGTAHAVAIRTGPPTPVVTLQPVSQFQVAGGTVSFSGKGQGLYGVTYQWQTNTVNLAGATNPTLTLTSVSATHAGNYRLIVTDNGGYGSIASSNASLTIVTPPVFTYQSTPTNLVTIYGQHVGLSGVASAPGQTNGFPLTYQWQLNGTNFTSPTNTLDFFVGAGGDGLYTLLASNAAGTASVSWQVTVTNAINVTNDLLLIYNTNSTDSKTVLDYYLAHRPNVGGANVLGIGYTNPATPNYFEKITPQNLTSQIFNPLLNWLTNNPTKRPQYVVLFMDLPSRVNSSSTIFVDSGTFPSVSVQLHGLLTDWQPYVTHLNMGMTNTANRTNDSIAYINKLASIGVPVASGDPVLSARLGGYANTNYVLDNVRYGETCTNCENYSGSDAVSSATNGLLAAAVSSKAIQYYDGIILFDYYTNSTTRITTFLQNGSTFTVTNYRTIIHATNAMNVAGYVSWGVHGSVTSDEILSLHGDSGWWLINTIESYNGRQYTDQGNFNSWFSPNKFGGTNYSNTPVGAVTTVEEPNLSGKNDSSVYLGSWAKNKNFGICAWESFRSPYFQAVGDPLTIK